MDQIRLSNYPSTCYLALFDERSIKVTKKREAGYFDGYNQGDELIPVCPDCYRAVFFPTQHPDAWYEIKEEKYYFSIQFEI